jgi:Flp pilus assembly protein TadG
MLIKLFAKDEKAIALIETGLISFTFAIMVIGLLDFGAIISNKIQMNNALRIGEQFIINNPTSIPAAQINVTTNNFCECNNLAALCGSVCVSGIQKFFSVTVSHSVSLFVNYPNTPNPYILTNSFSVRIP